MTKGQTYLLSLTVGGAALVVVGLRGSNLFAPVNPAPYRFSTKLSQDLSTPEIKHLEGRLAKNPDNFLEQNELASLYFSRGRENGDVEYFAKAEKLAKDSLKGNPMMNPAKTLLAEVAETRHDFKGAIRYAEEALRETPQSLSARGTLATTYLATGDLKSAARYAEDLVHARPGTETLLTRALVLAAQGRDDEALFDFKRAAELEDIGNLQNAVRLRVLWARLHLRRGELKVAAALLDEALRILPGNHLALFYKGTLELRKEAYQKAETLFLDAFQASHQTKYLISFARAKALAGDAAGAKQARDDAEKTLRKSLSTEGFGHRLELAELLLDDPKPSEAIVREAVELTEAELRERRSAEALLVLSRAYAAAGQWGPASQAALEGLTSGVREPALYVAAARAEASLGFLPRALFLVDKALGIDSGNPETLRARTEVAEMPKKKTVTASPPRS